MAISRSQSPEFKLPPVEAQALRCSWRNSFALQSDITWWYASVSALLSLSSSLALSRRRKWLRDYSLQDNDGTGAQVPKALDRLPDRAVCICVCVLIIVYQAEWLSERVGSVSGCTWTWFGAHSDIICSTTRERVQEKETVMQNDRLKAREKERQTARKREWKKKRGTLMPSYLTG